MPALLVNDFDLSLSPIGLKVRRIDGTGDGRQQKVAAEPIPGLAGQLPLANAMTEVAARTVTVIGTIRPRGSPLALEACLVNLHALCGTGLVEIRDGRDPGKVLYGYLESATETAFDPVQHPTDAATAITLRFACYDPARYAKSRLPVAFGALAKAIPSGNAPIKPVMILAGAGNNPTVTVRDPSGFPRWVGGFTRNLAAGDFYTVDWDAGTIAKSLSGVVTDAYSEWTTKGDGLLVLDPGAEATLYGSYLTIEVSAGSGLLLFPSVWS